MHTEKSQAKLRRRGVRVKRNRRSSVGGVNRQSPADFAAYLHSVGLHCNSTAELRRFIAAHGMELTPGMRQALATLEQAEAAHERRAEAERLRPKIERAVEKMANRKSC
jgi:hypothetical protein